MANAPVCNITPRVLRSDPAEVHIPNIPEAKDLQSALIALNAMRLAIMQLAGFQPPPPRSPAPNQQPGVKVNVKSGNNNQNKSQGRWVEANRQTEKVKVYNPEDKTQFVEVERIKALHMRDTKTGEQWVWTL